MSDCAHVAPLSAAERLREVATILAAGILQLRQRAALLIEDAAKNSQKQPPDSLELSTKTRLTVRVVNDLWVS
jgi:hypothetical protein